MDPELEKVTTPWGGRRFYAPGQHPAIRRTREALRRLQDFPDTPSLREVRAYYEDQVAAFEQVEGDCKLAALAAVRENDRGEGDE